MQHRIPLALFIAYLLISSPGIAQPLFPPSSATPIPDSVPWQLVGSDQQATPQPQPTTGDQPVFQLDLQQQFGVTKDPSTQTEPGNSGVSGPGVGSGNSGLAPGAGNGNGSGLGGAGSGGGLGGSGDPLNTGTTQQIPAVTGLIVDARGLDFLPSMSMRLFDPDGNQIYTTPGSDRELNTYFVATEGTAAYATSESQARSLTNRIGSKPELIKAKRTRGDDLIISNEDAWKLRQQNQADAFLDRFSVVVIWTPQTALQR